VACPVPGRAAGAPRLSGAIAVRFEAGSLLAGVYGARAAEEQFTCNFELNPAYREPLARSGVRFTAFAEGGEVRAMELEGHPFFVGTLFQPQLSSRRDRPHPIFRAFLAAVLRTSA
jgi:CTP synthase (UTP-ammonia lyase)